MTRIRCTAALFLGLAINAEATAQFFPVFGMPIVVQNGIDFQYSGRRLKVNGFIPTGNPYGAVLPVTPTPFGFQRVGPAYLPYGYGYPGYGSVEQRVTVHIINPPTLVQPRRGLQPYIEQYDLSGIDLDIEPASKIWGKKPEQVARPAPVKPAAEKKVEVAANVVKPPAPPLPRVEVVPEGQRLHDLGVKAFRNREYGLAMLRFRQAVTVEPPMPRALFLHGQALIAVGKYRDAAEIIQLGLQVQPLWPGSGFRPKVELYDNQNDEWNEHRKQLEDAQRLQPKNAEYLFLLGYLAWFDGQRDAAVDYFERSRTLAVDPGWNDAFLKVAAAKKE